jgi:amino acid adenylation domain-containing protein
MTQHSNTPSHAPMQYTPPEPVMLPASFAQELLWLMDRAAPGSVAYNVPRTRRLRGRLDERALRRACDALVERHEILRTTYATVDEQAVQVIHPPRSIPFELVDLSTTPTAERETALLRVVNERSSRPFDLSADLLLRATVLRLAPDEHVLLIESHHIAFDGWSRDIVFRELAELYEAFAEGREPALPALPIQYADFAIWQREQLQGAELESLLAWWRSELGDVEHVLRLPTDLPRPTSSRFEGVSRTLRLSPELADAVRKLGQRHDATVYMTLLAVYATVLHRWTGQPDVLVGSPIAGRARPETEGLIGYFANTIVQRARFAGDPTFSEVLGRLRESALGAYDHQDVPFEKLVLELEGRSAIGQSPLFQVVFTQIDASQAPAARLGDVVVEPFALDMGTTKFDLTLFMSDRPAGIELTLRARTDLFLAESVERFLGHFRMVLEAATAEPATRISTLPLLTAAERSELAEWNATSLDEGAPTTLTALFEAQAKRVPQRAAVVAGDTTLTYAALDARAGELAAHLRTLGVVRGVPVGLLLDRSADAIVGLLGILKAGGAYMPLSVDAPTARLAQQLAESGATTVVTSAALASRLLGITRVVVVDRDVAVAAESNAPPATPSSPNDIAYVLFTSGSTGTPKGVAVTHANAVHYARAISRLLADTPARAAGDGFAALDGWRFGLASTLAADLGNTSLLPALAVGGTLHVLDQATTTEPARFAAYVAEHPLDALKLTPSHLAALLAGVAADALAPMLPARWLVLGGEALRVDFARTLVRAAGTRCRLLNHYGPTETTVGTCTFEVTAAALDALDARQAPSVPIGRPLANTVAHVLDTTGKRVPVGVPGELWLGGAGVANGYLNRDDLTAQRFVSRAFDGGEAERLYCTGDRVRRLPDGALEFLGRADDQVKVRGYRVELGEIELSLRAHPGVAQAVATVLDDGAEPRLVAYVVPRADGYAVSHGDRATSERVREWVAAQLPEYMVPSAIVLLEALPLTSNGKVDRRALPAPDLAAPVDAYVAPATPAEERLAAIWSEVLKRERVGATDDFFALGGHSLLAIRVLGKISRAFGVRLPLRTLFDAPTVRALAELVELETKLAALEKMSESDASRLAGSTPPVDGPA